MTQSFHPHRKEVTHCCYGYAKQSRDLERAQTTRFLLDLVEFLSRWIPEFHAGNIGAGIPVYKR